MLSRRPGADTTCWAASGAMRRAAPRARARPRRRLPPLCPACREPLGEPAGLCAACWSRLSFIAPPYCERLGIPFVYDPGPGHSVDGSDRRSARLWTRPRGGPLRGRVARPGACLEIRRPARPRAAMLAGWMTLAGRDLLGDADALVPVPLHWRRLWARRFNQAATLALAICAASGSALLARRAPPRPRDRAAGRAVARSARRSTCRGPSGCRRTGARLRCAASGSCWLTTSSPRARPSRLAPARCCAPAP